MKNDHGKNKRNFLKNQPAERDRRAADVSVPRRCYTGKLARTRETRKSTDRKNKRCSDSASLGPG